MASARLHDDRAPRGRDGAGVRTAGDEAGRDHREAARGELEQVALARVPRDRGEVVEQEAPRRLDAAEPGEEAVEVVDVIPGAADDRDIELVPFDGRIVQTTG
jgi:hypothetical protein